jgi:ATP-dependent protease HslVU (ClpYQ) peptidase subunit
MTCICGIAEKGVVWIGGDSACVSGWETQRTSISKVFLRGQFLIGCAGSFRAHQIVKHFLDVELQPDDMDDETFMVVHFAEALRICLKEHGYTKIENNREEGGYFLVGYRSQLYYVASDFQVNTNLNGVDAIGAGREYAIGVMLALGNLPPAERIKRALEIAEEMSGAVVGPFIIESTENGVVEVE